MSNGPDQGDESASTTDVATPTKAEATDLDLRSESPEPTSDSLPVVAAPLPEPTDVATPDSQVTLASLAFRLFSTIETQIARDPNAAELTGLGGRLDVLERGVASSISKADALTGLNERMDVIDDHLAAPDPHVSSLTSLNDRLAAVEHRLAAPHPHSATINSLVGRLDEVESKGTPHSISALTERLEIVESRVPSPEDSTRTSERVTAIERRITAPEVIAGMLQQLEEMAMRFAVLDEPAESESGAGRRPSLFVSAILAVLVVVAIGVIVLVAVA